MPDYQGIPPEFQRWAIGARLPSPFYERIQLQDASPVIRTRVCKGCGYAYPTVEVFGYDRVKPEKDWPPNTPFSVCPDHPTFTGKLIRNTLGLRKLHQIFRVKAPMVTQIILLGGLARRYQCAEPTCGRRWTTGEFSPDGRVVADIEACKRCGGLTYSVAPRKFAPDKFIQRRKRRKKNDT